MLQNKRIQIIKNEVYRHNLLIKEEKQCQERK